MPAISVIMPAYNHERYVSAAVESVLGQTFRDLELVVIDDGSNDATGEIVRGLAAQDKRVRYIYQDNQDAYNALNRGLRESTGEWLAIINSDDLFELNRLKRLWDERGDSQCLFSDVTPIDGDGNEIHDKDFFWHQWHQGNRDYYYQTGDLYNGFLHGNLMVSTSNLFFSRRAFDRVGFFSPLRYLHDYDFIFRMLRAYAGQVKYIDQERLLKYRLHGSNTIKEGAIKARLEDQQVIRQYLLDGLPEALRIRAATGIDRLLQLERELNSLQSSPLRTLSASRFVRAARRILKRGAR
jgi:glycosyltransferase involved in cell wall biosynthesis